MILLKNCFAVFRGGTGADLFGADILIDGNRIARVAPGIAPPPGARVIDASRHVVLPGLINTHHHFYQTLTRALPAVQDAKLFDWLVYLYEIWRRLTPEDVFVSSQVGLGELLLTGCTTSTDHFYVFPKGQSGCAVQAMEPRRPCSSAHTKRKIWLRLGGRVQEAWAMARSAAHPLALSTAPL